MSDLDEQHIRNWQQRRADETRAGMAAPKLRVTMNGESSLHTWPTIEAAPWPEAVKERFHKWIAQLRASGVEGNLSAANYAEARPWRNEYDRGSNGRQSLVATIGYAVFVHDWKS